MLRGDFTFDLSLQEAWARAAEENSLHVNLLLIIHGIMIWKSTIITQKVQKVWFKQSVIAVPNYSLASIKFVIICKVCCWSSVLEKKVLLCIEDAYHSLCKRMCHGIIAPFSVIRNFHSSLLLTTHQEKWWKIHFPTFIYFRTIVW